MRRLVVFSFTVFVVNVLLASAVSESNGTLDYQHGSFDGSEGKGLSGSYAFPFGDQMGFQIEGSYSDISDGDFYGVGGQLFWRDSQTGMMALRAAGMKENDRLDAWTLMAHAEAYAGPWTFGAEAGHAQIDYEGGSLSFIESDPADWHGAVSAGVYPLEDLFVSVAYRNSLANGVTVVEAEFQSPVKGVSLFGNVATGDHDYDHAFGGIRLYFGSSKSLMARHREDHSRNTLNTLRTQVGTYGREYNAAERSFAIENDLPIPSGSYGGVFNTLHDDFRESSTRSDGGGFNENDATQI